MSVFGIIGVGVVDYSHLSDYLHDTIKCFVFDTIPSTNDYLTQLPFSSATQVCIAAEQTQGKGQYNRQWLSQKHTSVLLSIRRVFLTDVPLSGLSLVMGLAVVETLEKYGIAGLQLKWPNDVYFEDKKLAGILIENSLQNNHQSVVIGLGLNHHLADNFECKTPWIDIRTILGFDLDAVVLSADLIHTILRFCDVFSQLNFAGFHAKWRKYDYLLGKTVVFKHEGFDTNGHCLGVDEQGLLCVESKNEVRKLASSISLLAL